MMIGLHFLLIAILGMAAWGFYLYAQVLKGADKIILYFLSVTFTLGTLALMTVPAIKTSLVIGFLFLAGKGLLDWIHRKLK